MATWTPLNVGHSRAPPRSVRSVQAQTEPGPPSAGDGISLVHTIAVMLLLRAPGGQTFTGDGALRGWALDPISGAFKRAPLADVEDLTAVAGLSEAILPAVSVVSSRESFAYLCDGVGLSGAGGNVTVDILAMSVGGLPA